MSEQEQVQLQPQQTSTSKVRASVEYNGMELICAILLMDRTINTYDQLLSSFLNIVDLGVLLNNASDLEHYVSDIQKKSKIVSSYIQQFNQFIINNEAFKLEDILCVFVSGKKNKHVEINDLNKDSRKIEAKSDIYIKYKNNTFVGISVKQSKDATKSNYSVQKMLGKDTDKYLTKLKKDYLTEHGFSKFNKEDRENVNVLFYPRNRENTYMNALREEISKKRQEIAIELTYNLYCSNSKYDVYEFNGTQLYKLNRVFTDDEIHFEEHLPYYYDSKGQERNAAKLFYKLTCDEKNYRVEVRWKGNIHNASPQFQIHDL